MPLFVAEAADIDLSSSIEEAITLGGLATGGRSARVTLRIGEWVFEAPVWFCDPWPWDFGLLGVNGFFRYFTIEIDPNDECTLCEPRDGAGVVFAPLAEDAGDEGFA
jgi:hypothetical protein